jgi:hypothetical protein
MFKFSHVASREEESTLTGRHGLLRTATAGVSLHSAASENWEECGAQKWFLPLKAESIARAKTLRQLSEDLQRKRNDVESLRLLDMAASLLMEKCRQLHQQNCGIGMLTPDDAVLVPLDQQPLGGNWTLLLLDHGFVFEHDRSPFAPSWIANPPEVGRCIWDAEVKEQQWRSGTQFRAAADVRLLVRLFQGLLTGRWQRSLLTASEVVAIKSESQRLWKILDKAISDPDATVQKLESDLLQNPLSSHFRRRPKQVSAESQGRISTMLVALIVFAAIAGAGSYFWISSQRPKNPDDENAEPKKKPAEKEIGLEIFRRGY